MFLCIYGVWLGVLLRPCIKSNGMEDLECVSRKQHKHLRSWVIDRWKMTFRISCLCWSVMLSCCITRHPICQIWTAVVGGNCFAMPKMDLPPFKLHGRNTDASSHWSDLPDTSRGLTELIKCNCTKGCTGNCKCRSALLSCTELCKCKRVPVNGTKKKISRGHETNFIFLELSGIINCV